MSNNTTNELLKSLEALYLEQNYDKAQDILLANKSKFSEGVFHYNLGTIFAKKGEMGPARFHLEKALQKGKVDTNTLKNLDYIKQSLVVRDLSYSPSISDKIHDNLLMVPGQVFLSITLILLITALLIVKKKIVQTWWKIILIFALANLPIAFEKLYLNKKMYAVFLKEGSVREGPSEIYPVLYDLPEGTKVIIGKVESGWYFVERPLNLAGWVSKKPVGLYK